ncbi:hypothetical protein ACFFMN_08790 [Planobispora siamensis]|uniref:Uncharacterized protein n=1 Tax=Planobispora siamensis TaxID=936338 RepID=A0A8J3SCY2_9ACTN|nr:hypothetical protein [Planobispora siamensis]GIH91079.1 hypothetical protein Psi01_17090 [Planobispora siamensis]
MDPPHDGELPHRTHRHALPHPPSSRPRLQESRRYTAEAVAYLQQARQNIRRAYLATADALERLALRYDKLDSDNPRSKVLYRMEARRCRRRAAEWRGRAESVPDVPGEEDGSCGTGTPAAG